MKKRGKIAVCVWLLLFFPFSLSAGQDPEKLFLEIKELSGTDPHLAELRVGKYLKLGGGKDEKITANTYYLLGRVNYFKSRNYLSNQYYQLAIESTYAQKDPGFAESCYNNMGVNYEMQAMIPEAMRAYQKSLSIAEKLKDSVSIGQSWINLGLLYAKINKYGQAREVTLRALAFFQSRKDILNIALCYQNLGYIMSEQQYHSEAVQYYYRSLELNQKAGNQFEVLNNIFNLGSNYSDLGQYAKGEQYLAKAYRIASADERFDIIAKVCVQRGENNIFLGRYALAEQNLRQAMALIEKYEIFDLEHLLYHFFKSLYAKSGNFASYQAIGEKIKAREQARSDQETRARTDEVQALYEFQQHLRKIRNQEKSLNEQRRQTRTLILLSFFLALILTIVAVQYFKARKYMRSLFENAVERTLLDRRTDAQPANRNYLLEVYGQVLAYIQNEGRRETDIMMVAKHTGIREEYIAQAVRTFGDPSHNQPFFRTFYVEELCRRMILSGDQTDLKKVTERSPFDSYLDFARTFRHITGLWPQQFLNCCEARLREQRSAKSKNAGHDPAFP